MSVCIIPPLWLAPLTSYYSCGCIWQESLPVSVNFQEDCASHGFGTNSIWTGFSHWVLILFEVCDDAAIHTRWALGCPQARRTVYSVLKEKHGFQASKQSLDESCQLSYTSGTRWTCQVLFSSDAYTIAQRKLTDKHVLLLKKIV